jgi:dolichyl-phosphate beta-glucosyltransferase
MPPVTVSVVIPVFNEADDLVRSLTEISAYFSSQQYPYELIVVNDGSTDATLDLLTQFSHSHPDTRVVSYAQNRGKGYAVKAGMLAARGEYRFFFDIDLAVPLSTVEPFFADISSGAYDAVIGTRKTRGAIIVRHQPWYREVLGKGFSRLTNAVLGTSYSDITCGFKCFTRPAAEKIFSQQAVYRWSFDAEILFLTKRFGYRVREIPVTWKDNPDTRVRVLRDVFRSFWELLRIRMIYR